jgi:hypothetical protein
MQARGFIRGGALVIYRGQVLRGFTAIVDEEWDDWHAPQLTTATCHAQFEGIGRNDFGCQIIEATKLKPEPAPAEHLPLPPPLPTAVPRPWHNVPWQESWFVPPDVSPQPWFVTRPWIKPARPELPKNAEPLRPFCFGCGWRQGGSDSWNGQTCKCGTRSEPLVGQNGGFFYA